MDKTEVNIFQFSNTDYLYLLLIIPAIILIFTILRMWRKRSLQNFGDWGVISNLMPDYSFIRPIIKFTLVVIALAAIIFAIAGPRYGEKLKEQKRKGVELIIALDISNSMLAEDIKPNRLENAKRAIWQLTNELDNDKIGLITFAGNSYIQVPITADYAVTRLMVSAVTPDMIEKQGTAIGSAIDLALNSFGPNEDESKVLVIITDGENHEDDPVEMAAEAADRGIVVHTIGMGLPKGAPIPKPNSNDFWKDREGSVVVSKLDEKTLQEIAAAGNGIYIRANNTSTGLKQLFREVEKMDKMEFNAIVYDEFNEQFGLVAGIALFILFIEMMILGKRNKIFRNLKLFEP